MTLKEQTPNWNELSWQEKRKLRMDRWLAAEGVEFKDAGAKKKYRERVTRWQKALSMEEPDRVPVMLPSMGLFPAYHAGYDLKTVMYDYEKQRDAWMDFMYEMGDMDTFVGPGFILPGPALEIMGHRLHAWPGHGVPDSAASYQFVEGEYMKADEYDKIINDPSDFWLRTFMPRQAEAYEPWANFMHLNALIGLPHGTIAAFSTPEMKEMFQRIWKAGDEINKWMDTIKVVDETALKLGYPSAWSMGMGAAPFDTLTDMCRGTKGIFMDMYRQPEKIIEAAERLVPIIIETAIEGAEQSLSPVISMPLHKGNKTFMSPKQFEKFYWPTLKKVLTGYIEEGFIPMPFAEGDYNPRLEVIQDMPHGSMAWYFEDMDMARAKETVGKDNCIGGNLAISILATGTPRDVKEAARKLIETCAPGGGYVLMASAHLDWGDINNMRAMMEAAQEYGIYR